MVESQWRDLYKAAILELDPKQLQARVKAAEDAINARASRDARIPRDERRAMDDALSTLRSLKLRSLNTSWRRTMPNIYYCNGLANNGLGMLRAVLSWEESRNLLKLCSVQYAGLQFPTMAQGRASGFAVLRILDEERSDKWQVGFYSFDCDILHIEEWVQTCVRSKRREQV
jgi:hypothetical protein